MKSEQTPDYSEAFSAFRRAIEKFSLPDLVSVPWHVKNAFDPCFTKVYGDKLKGSNIDVVWSRFFAEICQILPAFIVGKYYKDGPDKVPAVRSLRGNWSSKSARNEDVAYAAYFCAHMSRRADLREAAKSLDKLVFGNSFATTFGVEPPKNDVEAIKLNETIEERLLSDARVLPQQLSLQATGTTKDGKYGSDDQLNYPESADTEGVWLDGSVRSKRRASSFATLLLSTSAVIAFCILPVFSNARVTVAKNLSGTAQATNITHLSQFDRQQGAFFSELVSSVGFLILEHEARNGSARATHLLGLAKVLGINIPKDVDGGVALFQNAHEAGYYPASNSFAYALKNGLGSYFDTQRALEIYEGLEKRKLPSALNSIGNMYKNGNLKPYNPRLALKYYEEASVLGNANAYQNLGDLYYYGAHGHVKTDRAKSKAAYETAFQAGIEDARDALARLHFDNEEFDEGLALLEEGAARNETHVMISLAKELLSGEHVDQDVARARLLLDDAVSRGNGDAAFDLAELIEKFGPQEEVSRIPALLKFAENEGGSWTQAELGFRAEHDPELHGRAEIARKHYQNASDFGHGRASYRLAEMMLDGRLRDRSPDEAIALLRRGVARGDPYAQLRLAKILLNKDLEPTDARVGLEMLRTAGERGDDWVVNNVGVVFSNGNLVKQDDTEAAHWYLQAYEREGYDWAACNYVSAQLRLDPSVKLAAFDEELSAGIGVHSPVCLGVLFEDPHRTATWGQTYEQLQAVLEQYIDVGLVDAIEYLLRLHEANDHAQVSEKTSPKYIRGELEVAAGAGSIEAMLFLGKSQYTRTSGARIELDLSVQSKVQWLREAASKGSLEAVRLLQSLNEMKDDDSQWFESLKKKALVEELADDEFLVGYTYETGTETVHTSLREAEDWYVRASDRNQAARIRLIRLLVEGCHRQPHFEQALRSISEIENPLAREMVAEAVYIFVQLRSRELGQSHELELFLDGLRAMSENDREWEPSENFWLSGSCGTTRHAYYKAHVDAIQDLDESSFSTVVRMGEVDILYLYQLQNWLPQESSLRDEY